jgi:hypothetical protein
MRLTSLIRVASLPAWDCFLHHNTNRAVRAAVRNGWAALTRCLRTCRPCTFLTLLTSAAHCCGAVAATEADEQLRKVMQLEDAHRMDRFPTRESAMGTTLAPLYEPSWPAFGDSRECVEHCARELTMSTRSYARCHHFTMSPALYSALAGVLLPACIREMSQCIDAQEYSVGAACTV